MEKTERVELTVLCLIYKNSEILLQNRINKDWKGYTLPGGHVEKDESFVNAVIREMKEETGLTIKNPIIGEEYDSIILGFAPCKEDADLLDPRPYDGKDDYRLFYCGEELKNLYFPILSPA